MAATITLSTSLTNIPKFCLFLTLKFVFYLYVKVLLGNKFCFVWELYRVVFVRDYVTCIIMIFGTLYLFIYLDTQWN